MAANHIRLPCQTANLLKVLSSVVNHGDYIAMRNDVECFTIQVFYGDGRNERCARKHRVWP